MANEVDAQKMMAMLGALYDVDPKPPQRKEGSIRGGKTRDDVIQQRQGGMTAAQMPRYAQDYLAMMGANMPNMRTRADGGSMAGGALNIPYDMHDAPLPSRKEGKKPRPSRQEAIAKAQENQRRTSPQGSPDAAATAAGVDRPNTKQALWKKMQDMAKGRGMDWYEYPSGIMRSAPSAMARNNIYQMPAGLVEMLMANVFDPYATPNMAEPDYSDYPPRIANQRMMEEIITDNSLMNRLRLKNLEPLRSYEDRSQRGV
tara:strand:- start:6360 stop:7133 length:774 start_codon:yes stop_codon:yes gene_type:complete